MLRVSPVTGHEGYPGEGWRITSGFASEEYYKLFKDWHTGHDLSLSRARGRPIYAVCDGIVKFVHDGNDRGFGKMVFIQHTDSLFTRYAHLDQYYVQDREQVSAGQVIGLLGSTGRSTGPHLHFDVMLRNNALDWPGKEKARLLQQYIDPNAWYAGSSINIDSLITEKMRVVATAGLNVRRTPSRYGVRNYALEAGAVVDVKPVRIYASELAWRELASGGWVAEKYLETVAPNGTG